LAIGIMPGEQPQPLLALPGPIHRYSYNGDFTIAGVPIHITQEGGALGREGTGWAVWDASVALARHLEAAAPDLLGGGAGIQPPSILELGSGTGLAGLAAAAALRLPVALTDLPEVLPALRRNADANPQVSHLHRRSCAAQRDGKQGWEGETGMGNRGA
jgi:hypothetical protein